MADKKVVVNLDFNGNTIKNVLMESVPTLPTATSSIVGRFLYNSADKYVYYCYAKGTDPETYAWEKMAKGSIVDTIQTNYTTLVGTTLPAMQTQIDNNTAFRDNYTHVTGSGGAVDSRVTNQLTLYYDSTEHEIQLKWGSTEIGIVSTVDFLIDGMLSGAHLITRATSGSTTTLTYDNNGTATTITPGTTSVDGTVVTTNESGYPSVDGKYMRFVFNTEPADTKTAMWVTVSDLVDVYTAGYGINIGAGNAIAVKLKSGSGLTADSNGLYISDSVQEAIQNAALGTPKYETKTVSATTTQATNKKFEISYTYTTQASYTIEPRIISTTAYLVGNNQFLEAVTDVKVSEVSTTTSGSSTTKTVTVLFDWNTTGMSGNIKLEVVWCKEKVSTV